MEQMAVLEEQQLVLVLAVEAVEAAGSRCCFIKRQEPILRISRYRPMLVLVELAERLGLMGLLA
jgi:hypothetical protein